MTIHSCCSNRGKYLVEYDTGSRFKVCEKCYEDKYWSSFKYQKKIFLITNSRKLVLFLSEFLLYHLEFLVLQDLVYACTW